MHRFIRNMTRNWSSLLAKHDIWTRLIFLPLKCIRNVSNNTTFFFKGGNAFTQSTVLFLSTWMSRETAQGYVGLLGLAPRLPTKPYGIPSYCRVCRVTRCGETTAYVRGAFHQRGVDALARVNKGWGSVENICKNNTTLLAVFIFFISLSMSPLLGHRPSLWITHEENGP
jgi:hypothetical protein